MNIRIFTIVISLVTTVCIQGSLSSAETIYECPGEGETRSFTSTPGKGCNPVPGLKDQTGDNQSGATPVPQPQSLNTDPPPNVMSDENRNIISNEIGLVHFIEKVSLPANSQRNQITVYHFGDSHVRAAMFPRSIAKVLQQRFGDSGGAFCHNRSPATVRRAKSKSVSGQRTARPRRVLPPSRQFMEGSRQLWQRFEAGNTRGLEGSTLLPGLPPLHNTQLGPDLERPERPLDSAVGLRTSSDEICTQFGGRDGNNPVSPTGGKARGIVYNAYALPGKTFDFFSKSRNMVTDLITYRPDLIIITLGTNDAFAKLDYGVILKHISKLLSTVRSNAPTASILFTIPPDTFFKNGTNNTYTHVVRQAIIDFSLKKKCAWWDLYGIMGGAGSMNTWRVRGLAHADRIHFNKEGYRLQGEKVGEAIIRACTR